MRKYSKFKLLSGSMIATLVLVLVLFIFSPAESVEAGPQRATGVGFSLEEAVANGMSSFNVGSTFKVRSIEGSLVVDVNTGQTRAQYQVEMRVTAASGSQ